MDLQITTRASARPAGLLALVLLFAGCSTRAVKGPDSRPADARAADAAAPDSAPSSDGPLDAGGRPDRPARPDRACPPDTTCVQTMCPWYTAEPIQCGDCKDNDGDRLVDSADPECLSPCQNSEASYYGPLPGGDPGPCSWDCYFDNNTGHGNDECDWDRRCDPLEVAPNYDPEGPFCAYQKTDAGLARCSALPRTPSRCLQVCIPLTPNGCDCFGCCRKPGVTAGMTGVYLGGSAAPGGTAFCTEKRLNDPKHCRPCTLVASCFNPCDACELCLGKRALPASCNGKQTCPAGAQACGLACQPRCPAGSICITGCCVKPFASRKYPIPGGWGPVPGKGPLGGDRQPLRHRQSYSFGQLPRAATASTSRLTPFTSLNQLTVGQSQPCSGQRTMSRFCL